MKTQVLKYASCAVYNAGVIVLMSPILLLMAAYLYGHRAYVFIETQALFGGDKAARDQAAWRTVSPD